jgi:hypothetical protein
VVILVFMVGPHERDKGLHTVSSLTRWLTGVSAVATALIVGAFGWASIAAQPKTADDPVVDPSAASPEVAPDPTGATSADAVEDPTTTVVSSPGRSGGAAPSLTSPPRPTTTAGPTAAPSTTARPRTTTTRPITPPKAAPAPGRGGSHASSGAS